MVAAHGSAKTNMALTGLGGWIPQASEAGTEVAEHPPPPLNYLLYFS